MHDRALPDAPAAARLAAFLDVFNDGDDEAIGHFARTEFVGPSGRVGVPGRAPWDAWLRRQTGGLDLRATEPTSDGAAEATATARLTGEWYRLHAEVEGSPPHRLVGLGIDNVPPPTGPLRMEDEAVAALERLVDTLTAADLFSGAVTVARGDELLFERAYGAADRAFDAPNRPDTKFNLGSM